MTRKGFLSTLGLSVAAIAIAPTIKLLLEEKSICKSVVLPLDRYELTSIKFTSQMSREEFNELADIIENKSIGNVSNENFLMRMSGTKDQELPDWKPEDGYSSIYKHRNFKRIKS